MECLKELANKEKHLMDTLTDEDNELFSDYVDTYIRFLSICNTDSFVAGFRLKATDQMEWVRRMNNIISAVEEIILAAIVYA